MASPRSLSRASSKVALGEEYADEVTWLLPKQAAEPKRIKTTFGLWQVGALFGKQWFLVTFSIHSDLTNSAGILLAYADTSLVWATHETIASRFNSLQNSSWMMTSFTMGYCVTLPLVSCFQLLLKRLRCLVLWDKLPPGNFINRFQ